MGHSELLAAIKLEGDERLAAMRQAAAHEDESLRTEATARRNELRTEHERRVQSVCANRYREIMLEAGRKAAIIRLRAESDLALRMHERAAACLERLRESGYAGLFRQLSRELPDAAWSTVRVNPADSSLAAECFPLAAIVEEPAITGGFEAVTADGSLTVINTLESRLERCWQDLLPDMVAELQMRTA